MSFKKGIDLLEKILKHPILAVGNIGAGVIILMMLLTVVDVARRRLLNQPVLGAYELSGFMLVIVVFFAIARCEFAKGHITIDLLVAQFPRKTQNIISSIVYFFTLVTSVLLTWRLFVDATGEIGGTLSSTLDVPVFPFIYLAGLGCVFLSLAILKNFLQFIVEALKK